MDIINDILRSMHIRGRVCCHVELCSGSGVALDSQGCFALHSVLQGGCWAGNSATGEWRRLSAGDVLMLPRGGGYWFSDTPEAPDRAPLACLEGPFFSSVSKRRPPAAVLMGSVVDLAEGGQHPLIQGLAEAVTVPGECFLRAGLAEHPATLIDRTARGSGEYSTIVLDMLFEIFLFQALRAHYLEADTKYPFARALARPQIRDSLVAMHKDTHRNWTVERLAEVSGMSRSAFAQCFTEHVGVPVMRYLTLLRMYRALELIRSGESNFAEIPGRVGYLSQVAFQKAFKRVHGITPAQAKLGSTAG